MENDMSRVDSDMQKNAAEHFEHQLSQEHVARIQESAVSILMLGRATTMERVIRENAALHCRVRDLESAIAFLRGKAEELPRSAAKDDMIMTLVLANTI